MPKKLTEAAAGAWLPKTCFKTGPPERVGIELEYLLRDPEDPRRETAPDASAVATAATASGLHGAVTLEPGGQVEISPPPADGLLPSIALAEHDLRGLDEAARQLGLTLDGTALDPFRPPRRILEQPRYVAMEASLGRRGFPGRTMMCSTASIQVNLEAGREGRPGDTARRWELLHLVRPVLVAAFGNSPLRLGRPTGWKSTRQAVWLALDPDGHGPRRDAAADPGEAWANAALDAELVVVRRPEGAWSAPPEVTFRDWLRHGEEAVPGRPAPELADLEYHLTTLFPPVRARGHLEVRYLDSQPGAFWQVPVAVLVALTEDDAVADAAREAAEPVRDRVLDAARLGMADPALARAARAVLTAAAGSLRDRPDWAPAAGRVEQYLERWTLRDRSPADDLLDESGGAR